jgi:hypothetical protein
MRRYVGWESIARTWIAKWLRCYRLCHHRASKPGRRALVSSTISTQRSAAGATGPPARSSLKPYSSREAALCPFRIHAKKRAGCLRWHWMRIPCFGEGGSAASRAYTLMGAIQHKERHFTQFGRLLRTTCSQNWPTAQFAISADTHLRCISPIVRQCCHAA